MSKRQIPRAVFEPWEGVSTEDLLQNDQFIKLAKQETPKAIKEAFLNKKTFATLFQINHTENYLDIPKQYWIPALEECIKYLIEDQKYEECRDLTKLIDSIKAGTKTINKQLKQATDGKAADRDTSSN